MGPLGAAATTTEWIGQFKFRRYPHVPGYDSSSFLTAPGLIATGSTFAYNYVNPTPLNWIMPSFVAYRGAVHWTFDVSANGKLLTNLSIVRDPSFTGNPVMQTYSGTSGSMNQRAYILNRRSRNTFGGTTLVNQNTQTGVSVSIPNMTQYKFQSCDPLFAQAGSTLDGSSAEAIALEVKDDPNVNPSDIIINAYVGAGTDFNLHYFLNVPTMYQYGTLPVPA